MTSFQLECRNKYSIFYMNDLLVQTPTLLKLVSTYPEAQAHRNIRVLSLTGKPKTYVTILCDVIDWPKIRLLIS